MNSAVARLPRRRSERLAAAMVSRRVGLASELRVDAGDADSFFLSLATLKPARIVLGGKPHALPNFGGVGQDAESATVSGLMELAERYCGAVGGSGECWAHPRGAAWLDSAALRVFAPWQYEQPGFPFRRIDAQSRVRWLAGRSLRDGRRRHVPLAWARVPFLPLDAQEQVFCSNSSGLASGFTHAQALTSALLELCERDAFMVMWHQRLSLPRIEIGVDELLDARVSAQVAAEDAEVHFVDLTNDLRVPVAMCVLLRSWRGRRLLSVGLAARHCIREACRKAFFEAAGEHLRQRQHLAAEDGKAWRPSPDFLNVTDFAQHSLVYTMPEFQREAEFLWAGPNRTPQTEALPQDGRALLRALIERVAAHCDDIVVVPLTTPDVRTLGVHVLKVIAPGLVSINSDHRYPHFGSSRLWTAAVALGATVDPAHRDLPNRFPHPLA